MTMHEARLCHLCGGRRTISVVDPVNHPGKLLCFNCVPASMETVMHMTVHENERLEAENKRLRAFIREINEPNSTTMCCDGLALLGDK